MFHRTTETASAPIGHQEAPQLHYFNDGDESVVISTYRHANGEYSAAEHEATGLRPIGWGSGLRPIGHGFSIIGAIADLFEKMPRAASEREERDRHADLCDRNQDQRKEYLR